MACYRGLLDLGYAPEDIVVAGDSAGGNLTLVLLQQALKQGLPHCFPVMFGGMLPEARIALQDMVEFIQRNLHATPTAFVAQTA